MCNEPIIVGSTALKYFGLNRNEPKDIDRWFVDGSLGSTNQEDDHIIPKYIFDMIETKNGYATPDTIYTIKCSHFQWDIKWEKTKQDILWLKSKGCKLKLRLYDALVEHWKDVHGDKTFLSLNKSKEDFFTDGVVYRYDHDYLHELVAHPNEPAYKQCLKVGADVTTDYNKFCNMPYSEQVRMFREEITVIACERWLLNPKNKITWYESYLLSLNKTLTRLTKGWASDFIIFNIEDFVKPDYEMFKYLLTKLEVKMGTKADLSVFHEIFGNADCSKEQVIFELAHGGGYGDLDLGKIEGYRHLEQEGVVTSGGSEYCHGVFEYKGVIYRAEWSYYSYDGHDYDYILNTVEIVKPVQRMVTFYE